jgi:hypothetical protein
VPPYDDDVECLTFRVIDSFGPNERGRFILNGRVEAGKPEPGQAVDVESADGRRIATTTIEAVELRPHRDGSVGIKITLEDLAAIPQGTLVRGIPPKSVG